MDERTLWRFKTCAITITSPNQQGREGADSEEVWILTGKSVILLNRSSLNHGNGSLFPFKEAYFYACSLPARTSLRISWEYLFQNFALGHVARFTPIVYLEKVIYRRICLLTEILPSFLQVIRVS